MHRIIISVLAVVLTFSGGARAQDFIKKGLYIACGDTKVHIIDPQKSTGSHTEIVWTWDANLAEDMPSEYKRLLLSIDECKPVLDNSKILICSSSGATVLVDVKTKAVEFYAKTAMAHSADLLPGNRIAVANSTHRDGNNLELYQIGKPEVRLFTDTLYSGHGVVWDKSTEKLYVLGFNRLKRYALQNWDSDTPSVKLEKFWLLPDEGGHDLIPGPAGTMLISAHDDVYQFDMRKESFSIFKPLQGKIHLKSMNYIAEDQNVVYTVAEESWWTENIYQTNSDKVISLPGLHLYKVRVVN